MGPKTRYRRLRIEKSLSLGENRTAYPWSISRRSVVGIATAYGLDGQGIESRWGARFSAPVQTGPEAHPAPCKMGTGSFPEEKRPKRDVDPSPPSNAEVKIE